MLLRVSGIVLHQLKYSESSIIVKIYTREMGMISFIVKGSRNKKSLAKASLFSHLLILDVQFNFKAKSSLQHLKEARPEVSFHSLYSDIRKSAIALFINELLYKSIREEEPNEILWDFVKEHLCFLEERSKQFSDFHLYFMIRLTQLLGFSPNGTYTQLTPFFDIREGVFTQTPPLESLYLESPLSLYFSKLDQCSLTQYQPMVPLEHRTLLVERMIEYYKTHLPGFGSMQSHRVLTEVFNE